MTSVHTDLDSPMVDTMIPSNIAQDVLPLTRMRTMIARGLAIFLSLAVVNITVPAGAMSHLAPDPKAPKPAPALKAQRAKTRVLSQHEMQKMQGKTAKNPYLAGQSKWDVMYKGVNLLTGSFNNSETDLTFEGGYGIPVNATRSYNSNNSDEGPLGIGWSLSVDIRSTAGGLLKSSAAPVRSVPIAFKERPATQNDPRIQDANEPVEAVIATDAGGFEETIQKDADGILTTPSWDKNRNVSEYEDVVVGGSLYQILKKNIVTTPEGTVYIYEKKGSYPNGTVPYDDSVATPNPANVLKITTVTDRHGNQTAYTYGTGNVTFAKSNGTTSEKPLTNIQMPNGHEITFTWTGNRITSATDGVRTVTYGYTNGLLTSVTTPAGKVTTYGYGSSVDYNPFAVEEIANDLLTSITDPRGLTTSIYYAAGNMEIDPYSYSVAATTVTKITAPNGVSTDYRIGGVIAPHFWDPLGHDIGPGRAQFCDYVGTQFISYGGGSVFTSTTNPWFKIRFGRSGTSSAISIPYGAFDYRDDLARGSVSWSKTYNALSQNLLEENSYTYPKTPISDGQTGDANLDGARRLVLPTLIQRVATATTYNFLGNPLSKTVTEQSFNSSSVQQSIRTATVQYAYWGKEKYYQQKAVKDQAGRVSFTEYYDWNAAQGKRGQTYRVYDEARTSFSNKTATNWKYVISPSDAIKYSGQFDYDAKGRPTDVWKIQKTTPSPWVYVQTHTEYGADTSPVWGAATSVVEDYGNGKINRTTTTLAYDSIGRATRVRDAAGREFHTNYDLDGVVQSVLRVDGTNNDLVVSYTYGTIGLLNGMVTQVVDGLSGITQDLTYSTSGGGVGQVSSITETNGSSSYTTSYTYATSGERETSTYATPNGTTQWKYSDYIAVGSPTASSRIFQTLTKLDSNGNPTSEQFHYQFDSSGRLTNATFAQTPQNGQATYSGDYPASTRARAFYVYDPAGRVMSIENYWDTWGGSNYTSTPIISNTSSYELTGLNRGLKVENSFYKKNPNSNSWVLERTENFGYDANLDYLTSAYYNDGLPNENPSWSYDAAGNRNDASVVDNLNRATMINGVSRTYGILGNTLTKGSSVSYGWDVLNRMISFSSGSDTVSYQYRADGMRTKKIRPGQTDWFYYEGQMPIETAEITSSAATITRNTLGARGIDCIERVGNSTTIGYPLYDGHGNMVATLTKVGSSFTVNDQRTYDAWGMVRSGNATGDPKNRYVAKLGHVDDDESGLTYMRARYYETSSGRFISQDLSKDGNNWFTYVGNNPVNKIDNDGNQAIQNLDWNKWLEIIEVAGGLAVGFATSSAATLLAMSNKPYHIMAAYAMATVAIISFIFALNMTSTDRHAQWLGDIVLGTWATALAGEFAAAKKAKYTVVGPVLDKIMRHSFMVMAAITALEWDALT